MSAPCPYCDGTANRGVAAHDPTCEALPLRVQVEAGGQSKVLDVKTGTTRYDVTTTVERYVKGSVAGAKQVGAYFMAGDDFKGYWMPDVLSQIGGHFKVVQGRVSNGST